MLTVHSLLSNSFFPPCGKTLETTGPFLPAAHVENRNSKTHLMTGIREESHVSVLPPSVQSWCSIHSSRLTWTSVISRNHLTSDEAPITRADQTFLHVLTGSHAGLLTAIVVLPILVVEAIKGKTPQSSPAHGKPQSRQCPQWCSKSPGGRSSLSRAFTLGHVECTDWKDSATIITSGLFLSEELINLFLLADLQTTLLWHCGFHFHTRERFRSI